MTLFAQGNSSTVATGSSSTAGLLASLKGGQNASGSLGLFDSLLAQTQDSLPTVAPQAPSTSSAASSNGGSQDRLSRNATSETPSLTRAAVDRDDASTQRGRRQEEKDASSVADAKDAETAKDSVRQEKTQNKREDDDRATQEATQADDAAQASGKASAADQKDQASDADNVTEEEAALVGLLGKGPFVETKEETTKSDDAQDQGAKTITTDETPNLTGLAATGTPTEETVQMGGGTKKVGKKTTSESETQKAEALIKDQAETTPAQTEEKTTTKNSALLQEGKTENFLPFAEKTGKNTGEKSATLAPTASAQTASASMPVPEAKSQTSVQQNATVNTTAALATAATASSDAGATESAAASSSGAISGANAASAGASGVRTATIYDFASQLSAARVNKGGATGLPQAVEQVAVQINKAVKDGVDEITVQLKPAELGKIEVKLSFTDDKKVHATVIADSASTLSMLQKDESSLHRAFQEAGLQTDANSLQFSLRDQSNGQGGFAGQQQDNSSSSGGNWSNLSLAAEEGLPTSDASDVLYLTPGRVNLRV